MAWRALPLIWLIACGVVAAPALAQQTLPPQEPILRIDPGMHTAPVFRIGVDAACTLLATGSHDKTVRLWRLPEGKLLRTLRPPIGPGNDGQVYAVALAPDGNWVAAGGWTVGGEPTGDWAVYIFDTATGLLGRRLGGISRRVNHLAVSTDGRYLAAVLKDGHGLRVWDTQSWQLIVHDENYGGQDANGAAFDRADVLYTVASDGKLRRYAPGLRDRPTWNATRGGQRPYSIAVHPSGGGVAVGYADSTAVEVYDAATLAWRFAADTASATQGHLAAVAWSADGTRLYAGGLYWSAGYFPILAWDQAGKGPVRAAGGPQNTVMHLLPCGNGIAMGAFDPAFGLFAPDGSLLAWREGVQADLRLQVAEQSFSVASDGRRVHFQIGDAWGGSPVLFHLAAEQLTDAPTRPDDLARADTTSLPVTDWLNDLNPKLAGATIRLGRVERSRSLAIAPDKARFVLGTSSGLLSYDKAGMQQWRKRVPSEAWGVNITGDGQLVVVAYGDGTLRWHRLSDGEELLALFVHKLDRRWVAWTPKGYYMASPGAESLIGWHVNRDWDEAARFYPVDRFREQFNRPDIVKLVLETLDEGKAIDEANRRAGVRRAEEDVRKLLPPMVVIQGPGDDSPFRSPEVTIDYRFYPAAGKAISKVEYLIDGAAYRAPLFPEGDAAGRITAHKLSVPLPRKNVTISLVAYEGDRPSEPATIRLRWDGPQPGKEDLKRLRALFVGVDAYASPKLGKLRFAAKDAADLAAFFKEQEGTSYSKVESKVLPPDATREAVIDGLEWLEKGSEKGDVNLLFLAGHGTSDERQRFYFMAADSDPDKLGATGVPTGKILETIRNLEGTRIVILDACRSGAGADGMVLAASPAGMNKVSNELGDRTLGVILYASARGPQVSFEHKDWLNGAFTKALIEGLRGAADPKNRGYVETDALSVYVRERVEELTSKLKLGKQEPVHLNTAPQMKLVQLK